MQNNSVRGAVVLREPVEELSSALTSHQLMYAEAERLVSHCVTLSNRLKQLIEESFFSTRNLLSNICMCSPTMDVTAVAKEHCHLIQ